MASLGRKELSFSHFDVNPNLLFHGQITDFISWQNRKNDFYYSNTYIYEICKHSRLVPVTKSTWTLKM